MFPPLHRRSTTPATLPLCTSCGSTDIVTDAWACWDADRQCWTVQAVFDHTECQACGTAAAPHWQLVTELPDIDGASA